ncbi:NAD-dependent epimerase/dehydratase family protein [Pontixanthobacter gangjinensis]|uniref:NAD-dependent epimerase/dehydratase family protein n=1 Tax=Christiangramia aestuarii TaxID=1028746 RepID=A0A7K1LN99_9FLAO|nr:NAD-dependent epimerase/dehydratase family protein [Christiangramia aestuarii]MUP42208.1 NAD-dependent epimerase/dehydratase family protein [Christiangramia aestuarii]
MKKSALVLGGAGFIGGHIAYHLKNQGFWVRIADIKAQHEFWSEQDICDEYLEGDLREPAFVERVLRLPTHLEEDGAESFDEVYQFAADMGGAGYVFTGENDADIMHNSVLINLNLLKTASKVGAGRIFYSSSACMYPEANQMDSSNPDCREDTAYPANPDSEYGWEKLFSERLFFSYHRNYKLNIRIARLHNVFGPKGTWQGGKEKAPAAMCRKVIEAQNEVEVWGDGSQTRSFLYIEEAVKAIFSFVRQDNFRGPVNIGSEEMVSINELARMAIEISGKDLRIKNIAGREFEEKYGFPCPLGVRGRNSNNALFSEKMGWAPSQKLRDGLIPTFKWIKTQKQKAEKLV